MAGHTGTIWDVGFSPDGELAATASSDGTVRLWNIGAQAELHRYDLGAPAFALEVSPDSGRIIAGEGSGEGTLWLFDTATAALERSIPGPDLTIAPGAIALDASGRHALAATLDTGTLASRLTLWDLDSGEQLRDYDTAGRVFPFRSAAISPDGRLALGGTQDFSDEDLGGELFLWDLQTGQSIRQFAGHNGPVWSLDMSSDNRLMASGSSDGSVILWDYATGEVLRRFAGHTGWVFDVAFSPDGRRLYSASADGTVRAWQVSAWEVADLLDWVQANRHVREFTCEERAQYRIEPLCAAVGMLDAEL
ncbi:MAG: WD40 repeat domain-containing protein [Chloroflexota bacterium]